jgi:hypothetical protein
MKKLMQILAIPVLLIIGAAGWSFINKPTTVVVYRSSPQPQKQTPPTIIPTQKTAPTAEITQIVNDTTPLVYANPSVTIDAFQTAIPEKKYSDLLAFMTPNVTLIKSATSCCGLIPKKQAVAEMEYLSGATGSWNFSDSNPLVPKFEANDPENFKNVFIGTSSNYYAIGLRLNDDFLIDKIILVNDYRLITTGQ